MAKPVYGELEQRVRDLEAESCRLRQVEHELYQDQERYRIHFTLTNDVIYSLDTEFRVLSVSPSAEKILGYRPEELIGRTFQDLNVLSPEYLERAASDVFKVLSGEKIDSTVYQFITRDGRRIFGEVSGVPLVRDGRTVAVVSVARDITERLRMEQTLRESEERFRAIFDSAQDCVFIKDRNLCYTFVNSCMEKIFELPSCEIIGRKDLDLCGEQASVHTQEVDARVLAGEIVKEEDSRRVNGNQLTFHVIKVPMKDQTGAITGLCGIARNITERKMFEEVLFSKEKELEVQKSHLEEVNTALKVLLDHREEEKKKAQDDLVSTVEKLIFPYLEKMETAVLNDEGKVYLDILRTNLEEMISSYMRGSSRQYQHLTPTEIQIADLVKQGKTTKEIASIANVSLHAVSFHRANIRKKLGLLHAKTNLRSYLHCADDP